MATIRQTCAAWVKNTGKHMKAAKGNVYYDYSRTIYSYGSHFPIARIITLPSGEDIALFTTRGYSVSTGNHKRNVRSALDKVGMRIVYVWNPANDPSEADIADAMASAKDAEDRLTRARSEWRKRYLAGQTTFHRGNAEAIAAVITARSAA